MKLASFDGLRVKFVFLKEVFHPLGFPTSFLDLPASPLDLRALQFELFNYSAVRDGRGYRHSDRTCIWSVYGPESGTSLLVCVVVVIVGDRLD